MRLIAAIAILLSIAGCGKLPQGETGAQGPRGIAGLDGAEGPTGAAETIATGYICSKTDSGSGVTITLNYQSATYVTGNRFVTCSVANNSTQSSNSNLHPYGSLGSISGSCAVVADIDAASGGTWTFTNTGGSPHAVYTDATSLHNNYTYTFVAADCSVL